MSAAARGNPYLQVRLPQETHDRLKVVAGEGAGGKAGGVSLFVRRLIYRELGEPMPDQWGQEQGPLNDMLSALADVEQHEREGKATKEAVSLFNAILETTQQEEDLVARNLAFIMLGRMTKLLIDAGHITVASSRNPS